MRLRLALNSWQTCLGLQSMGVTKCALLCNPQKSCFPIYRHIIIYEHDFSLFHGDRNNRFSFAVAFAG